jgi:hypothetical protein
MRQCRICLDTENPESMVAPCRCRGSAEFIHLACLEEHLRHYPNNRCTVCHGILRHMSRSDIVFLGCLVSVCIAFLYLSNTFLIFKIFLSLLLGISLYNYTIYNLMTSDVSIVSIFFLFGLGIAPTHTFYYVIVAAFIGFLSFCTFAVLIPPEFIFSFVMTLFCALYAALIMISVRDFMDIYGAAIVFCILFLGWNSWVRCLRRIRV